MKLKTKLKTCVHPDGRFIHGVHRPAYQVRNLRENDAPADLGVLPDGSAHANTANFPQGDVAESGADPIWEIPNPFPFRGATFIIKSAADRAARNPMSISLPPPPEVSLSKMLGEWEVGARCADRVESFFRRLPLPLKVSLAANTTDPADARRLAERCCRFVHDSATGRPTGLVYEPDGRGRMRPAISEPEVFEVVVNNPCLPDDYKEAMVLRPGAQGESEIVGEWRDPASGSHVFEYLRRNSYIPWGHYAANMAHDAIRYRAADLTLSDITGMRHLYYQRTYVRVAERLGIDVPEGRKTLSPEALEALRASVLEALHRTGIRLPFNATLWGWNFGFGYAGSGYRLHASHQQVHQQYALLPGEVPLPEGGATGVSTVPGYACGDLVADFIGRYRRETGVPFFDTYLRAIRNNRRVDGDPSAERSLVIHEIDGVLLFVPKAQTSQWEVQLMTADPVGNILEAAPSVRAALDRAMLVAVRVLEAMGARMITTIECAKRFDGEGADQRLLYSFLPKLPYSPGAFTEAQFRWINGHYPEDFAAACRGRLEAAAVDLLG